MFSRLCVCMIPITLSTLVYVVTVTEADDESPALTSSVLHRRKTNYLTFAGKTYYFATIFKANFFQALQYCRQQNMQLLHIASQAENDRLERFSREIGEPGNFWTSGTNFADKDKWVWLSTGSNLVYTNWHSGEPNSRDTENCLEVTHYGGEALFTWNDKDCYEAKYFICESSEDTCGK